MIPRWTTSIFGIMILLISFSAMLEIIDRVMATRFYHRTISLEFTKSEFKLNEPVTVRVKVDRYLPDNCNSVVRRFISRKEDNVVVYSQIVPSVAENGVTEFIRTIYFPDDFPPGKYFLRSELVDVCRVGTYRHTTNYIPFTLVR